MAIVTEIKATKKVVTQISKIEVAKKKKLRVAAYARVSTKLEEQENSYELQINEYTKRINEKPDWVFAGIKVNAALISSETFFTETRKIMKKGLNLYTKIAMRMVDSKRMGKIIHLKLS